MTYPNMPSAVRPCLKPIHAWPRAVERTPAAQSEADLNQSHPRCRPANPIEPSSGHGPTVTLFRLLAQESTRDILAAANDFSSQDNSAHLLNPPARFTRARAAS